MRLRLLLLISLLLVGLQSGGAAAAEPGYTLGHEEIRRIFLERVSQGMPWSASDLEVRNVEAQPATLKLTSRAYSVAAPDRAATGRLGRNALTVAILVNGKEEGRVRVTGDLLLYGTVLCAAKKLDRHHLVAEGDLALVRRELGSLDATVLHHPEEAIGKELKIALQAGAILCRHQLENPALVKRGEQVTILAQSGEVRVTVPGKAEDSGAAGELVRVKNLMSRKVVSARVIDSGLVETEL